MFGNEEQPSCNWQPCEAGELVRMARRLKQQELLRQTTSARSRALMLAVPVPFVEERSWRRADGHDGGIGCREMISPLHVYEQDDLGRKKKTQVRVHLAEYGNCWLMQRYRKSQDDHTRY